MADSRRLVLMIQPTRLQGLIWQAVLKSQQLSVIWESPETDLEDNLRQLQQAGLSLPDLLLIDVRLRNFNPYAFCRWCRQYCPDVKVVLVNASKQDIIPSERQWAVLQGATDLLPAFDLENLMTTVADGVKRILKSLDGQPLDHGSLIAVLLNIKREIEARRTSKIESIHDNGKTSQISSLNGATTPYAEPPLPPLAQLKNNRSVLPKFDPNPPPPPPTKRLNSIENGYDKPVTDNKAEVEIPTDEDLPQDEPPPIRMYRGRKY